VVGTLCRRVKFFTFQLTAHIGLLKGTPNGVKSVWEGSHFATHCKMGPEPKEGGNAKSDKSRAGQAQNKKTDVRSQKSDVRFFCFLCSVFCVLSSVFCFGVSPRHALNWLNGWLNS